MPCADTQSKSIDEFVLDHYRQGVRILCDQIGKEFKSGKVRNLTVLKWYRDHRYLDAFGSFGYKTDATIERIRRNCQVRGTFGDPQKTLIVLELLDVIETLAKLEGITEEQVQVNELRLEIKNRTTL